MEITREEAFNMTIENTRIRNPELRDATIKGDRLLNSRNLITTIWGTIGITDEENELTADKYGQPTLIKPETKA